MGPNPGSGPDVGLGSGPDGNLLTNGDVHGVPAAGSDAALLVDAAEAGGAIALKYWRTDVTRWDKNDGAGPVTVADLEINEMLGDRLRAARPDYGWLSEESDDGSERLGAEHVFIVDPIDGTRAFIDNNEGFSVVLAVARYGSITAAAIHLPARRETYWASVGGGAWKNGARIQVSERMDATGSTVLSARIQMLPERWPGGVPPLERHFRSSLAWRMALVAEGRFDSMVTFRRSWEWDIAAGALIGAEAGAVVSDGNGLAMTFNAPDAMQAGVVMASPRLHADLMGYRQGPGS